jgi:hypothetical protein
MTVDGLLESFHAGWRILLWRKCLTETCQCFSFLPKKFCPRYFFIIPCVGVSTSTKYVIIVVCINETGSTVTLWRLEVSTFISIAVSEHRELIKTSLDAYPSIFRLFPFNTRWQFTPPWSVKWHARTLLCVYETHGAEQRWKAALSLLHSLRNQIFTVLFSYFCDVFRCFYWTVLVV